MAIDIADTHGAKHLERPRPHDNTAMVWPAIEHHAPALRDQRNFRLRFNMHARAGNRRDDDLVVVVMLNTEEHLGFDNGSTAGPVSNIELMCYRSRACPPASFPCLFG